MRLWVVSLARALSAFCLAVARLGPAACASAPPGTGRAEGESRDRPPRMLPGARPELRGSTSPAGRDRIEISVELMVDSTGQPDMTTFRLSGRGAAENATALRQWIGTARFEPATRGGRPVAGVYRTRMALRTVTRRM